MVKFKKIEWTGEQLEALEFVKHILGFVGVNMDHFPALKEIQEILKSELAGYEAIGIMDGTSYFEKVESRKAIKDVLELI